MYKPRFLCVIKRETESCTAVVGYTYQIVVRGESYWISWESGLLMFWRCCSVEQLCETDFSSIVTREQTKVYTRCRIRAVQTQY